MSKQIRAKQERVIEAVRHGLEGDAAVDFIRQSGYAMTVASAARHLKAMGGRARVQELLNDGKTNLEILHECFPKDEDGVLPPVPPSQTEFFPEMDAPPAKVKAKSFENTKITVNLPTDVHLALRFAAQAERKTQSQLVVEILTSALSQTPKLPEGEPEDA